MCVDPSAPARLANALDRVSELERAIRVAQAEQLAWVRVALDEMRVVEEHPARSERENREWADRSFAAELATTVTVHERTAHRMMRDAVALAERLPATQRAFAAGDVSQRHVRDLVDAAETVDLDRLAAFEADALEKAVRLTPAAFRRALARIRHHYEAVPLQVRKERALVERRLVVEPTDDGMAWVSLFCAAEHAVAIAARVSSLSRSRSAGDDRTKPQRDADCAVALLLGIEDPTTAPAPGDLGAVRAVVHVTVPVLSMLGHGDQPAALDGAPIDVETARALTAHAPSFRRILTDPETGAVLRYGRSTRRVPADLAGWLRVRDGQCRFPGCGKPAAACDLDHTTPWKADGDTDHDNLAHLCRHHHRLKHRTGWRMRQDHDGVITWTTPAGRSVETSPAHPVRAG